MSELTLYKDKGFKEPFTIENLGDVEAGDIRTVDGFLYNSTPNAIIDISYETDDRDVKVFNVPARLDSESWAKVEVNYAPDKLRTTPLNTFVTFVGKRRIPPE